MSVTCQINAMRVAAPRSASSCSSFKLFLFAYLDLEVMDEGLVIQICFVPRLLERLMNPVCSRHESHDCVSDLNGNEADNKSKILHYKGKKKKVSRAFLGMNKEVGVSKKPP